MIMDLLAELNAIYSRIPEVHCQGHCGNPTGDTCCGPIGCSAIEARLVDEYDGVRSPWITSSDRKFADFPMFCHVPGVFMDPNRLDRALCPHLSQNGKCRAYEARPAICRLWGAVKTMACPWGCRPQRWLRDKEAVSILNEIDRLSDRLVGIAGSKNLPAEWPASGGMPDCVKP